MKDSIYKMKLNTVSIDVDGFNADKLQVYIKNQLLGLEKEYCVVATLDNNDNAVSYQIVGVGENNKVAVSLSAIFENAVTTGADSIMMFHNHLSSNPFPSKEDIAVTDIVKKYSDKLNIPLKDHVIVSSSSGEIFSFKDDDLLKGLRNAKPFGQQVDETLSARKQERYNDAMLVDLHTPELLQELGLSDHPIFYTKKHCRKAICRKNNIKHTHGLTKVEIKQMVNVLENPVIVYDSLTHDDSIVLVSDMFDRDNQPIIVALRADGSAFYNGKEYVANFVASMYPIVNMIDKLKRARDADNLLYINKEKSQAVLSVLRPQLSKGFSIPTSTKIIHQSRHISSNNVNFDDVMVLKDSKDTAKHWEDRKIDEYRKSVADQFLKLLDKDNPVDAMSWVRHWQIIGNPRNVLTNIDYRGTNAFLLSLVQINKGYKDPRWITFAGTKQIEGAHVKKGEHGTKIQRWLVKDLTKKKGEKGAIIDFPERDRLIKEEGRGWGEFGVFPIVSTVFNVEQCEGIPLLELKRNENIHQDDYISTISASMDVPIYNNGGDNAYYVPAEDAIHLPPREVFDSDYAYNATALHELAHSSGAANRLNRDGITQGYIFGSPGYAYEELVAEMTSCFAAANLMPNADEAGIDEYIAKHAENHYKYVKGWADDIQDDPNVLINALAEAQLAADFLDVHGGYMKLSDFNSKYKEFHMDRNVLGDMQIHMKTDEISHVVEPVKKITQERGRHR